ncbi:hypothetical protein GT037_007596 [Alternaria burnsii]|uniref:Uncharacterized protein n=1 Tax=Alternaria burnsii TaxID=1187904 RepID=A0A8H7B0C9_9PLEO|nr:uncharacterized protein GT037_007596 [Alternaria burnsii]KAF7674836.1 hypothetical protein GT037_007596 [Alternaria burnsii]
MHPSQTSLARQFSYRKHSHAIPCPFGLEKTLSDKANTARYLSVSLARMIFSDIERVSSFQIGDCPS